MSLAVSRVVRDNAQCLRLKIRRTRARSVPWKIVKWFLAGSVEYRRKFLIRFLQLPDVVSINGSLNGFLFISHRLILISAYRLTCGNPSSSILSILLSNRARRVREARTHFSPFVHFPRPHVYRSVLLRDSRIPKIVIYGHERLENTFAPGEIFLSGNNS